MEICNPRRRDGEASEAHPNPTVTDLAITPEAQSSPITSLHPAPPVPSGQKGSKAVKVLAKGILGE